MIQAYIELGLEMLKMVKLIYQANQDKINHILKYIIMLVIASSCLQVRAVIANFAISKIHTVRIRFDYRLMDFYGFG